MTILTRMRYFKLPPLTKTIDAVQSRQTRRMADSVVWLLRPILAFCDRLASRPSHITTIPARYGFAVGGSEKFHSLHTLWLQPNTESTYQQQNVSTTKYLRFFFDHPNPMPSNHSLREQLARRFSMERGNSLSSLFQRRPKKNLEQSTSSIPSFSRTFSYVLSCSAPSVDFSESSFPQMKRGVFMTSTACGEGEDFGFEVNEEVSLQTAYDLYRVWQASLECTTLLRKSIQELFLGLLDYERESFTMDAARDPFLLC